MDKGPPQAPVRVKIKETNHNNDTLDIPSHKATKQVNNAIEQKQRGEPRVEPFGHNLSERNMIEYDARFYLLKGQI